MRAEGAQHLHCICGILNDHHAQKVAYRSLFRNPLFQHCSDSVAAAASRFRHTSGLPDPARKLSQITDTSKALDVVPVVEPLVVMWQVGKAFFGSAIQLGLFFHVQLSPLQNGSGHVVDLGLRDHAGNRGRDHGIGENCPNRQAGDLVVLSSWSLPGELSPLNTEPLANGLMPNQATSCFCMAAQRLFFQADPERVTIRLHCPLRPPRLWHPRALSWPCRACRSLPVARSTFDPSLDVRSIVRRDAGEASSACLLGPGKRFSTLPSDCPCADRFVRNR